MDNDALKQIEQRLAELPTDVRAAIQDSALDTNIRAIGERHKLHIDQMGELGDETMLAMLGFSPLETFGRRLSSTLNLAPEAGEAIAGDISREIFGSIRESMKKFAEARKTPSPTAPVQPVAATPQGPAAPQKPPLSPEMHQAEVMLSQKTVSLAPAATEKPIYKADPYREPV